LKNKNLGSSMDLMLSQEEFIMFEEVELTELSFVKDKNCIEEV
jgi:hypothetical protein